MRAKWNYRYMKGERHGGVEHSGVAVHDTAG